MAKLRVGLLFGGRSVEHEVSVVSATSVLQALDPSRYEVTLIGVDQDGRWHLGSGGQLLSDVPDAPEEVLLPARPGEATLVPSEESPEATARSLDVILPLIHGKGGEDGALQGLLELADVPYVGSGVLSSAMQMDKDVAKRLLRDAGLPVAPWIVRRAHELEGAGLDETIAESEQTLGWPVFVKPANSGSSVGISPANGAGELTTAIRDALRYDRKILIEKGLDPREIEVAVLGNEHPEASLPGEIRCTSAFYDYESKYHDDATELVIPAELDEATTARLREMAVAAYRALDAEGLARVDFIIDRATGDIYVNELNSLPGFTDGSMYPKMWEATGLSYPVLLDRLIELAMERHHARGRLETSYRRPGPVDVSRSS